jgi:hypothetical protein
MALWKIALVAVTLFGASAGYAVHQLYGSCACGDGCPCGSDCPCDH